MSVNAVDTDFLAVMRADLVAVLDELAIPWHDAEPRSLGDAPAAWFGRPTLTYDPFGKEVLADWPLTFAGPAIDGENTTHDFDVTLWELWRHFGLGRKAMADTQRSVTALEARPATTIIGERQHPIYNLTIRTTVMSGFC
jgi:hypothetical protein